MAAGAAPVWSAMRTTSVGAAAIDHRIGELRGDDLAPQPVMLERVGESLRHRLREIAAELAAEIGIVRHRRLQQLAVERELGVGEQHRQLRPRQRLRCACAARRAPCRRAGTRPRGRARRASPASASAAAGSRDPPARAARPARAPASADSCCAAPAAPTSSVISASSALRASHRQRAVAHRRRQRDLDVDLDVGGVDAGRIVDGVGVEPHAAQRRLDAAALRHAEIGALADHLAAQVGAGDADRRRWRGRRPRRRSPLDART